MKRTHQRRSRHRLPAPPLVLQPILGGARKNTAKGQHLLDVAGYLGERDLLTDGGKINLAQGLLSRKDTLRLTTQDVRGSAHALALELLAHKAALEWPNLTQAYYARYDRGKPRRPNRLQRLYLEWSHDFGPLGLLRAVQSHPRLRDITLKALPYLEEDHPDRQLLQLFFYIEQTGHTAAWLQAFTTQPVLRTGLLGILPLLTWLPLNERLMWLEDIQAGKTSETLDIELWLACHQEQRTTIESHLPLQLQSLGLSIIKKHFGEIDAAWLGVLKGYQLPRTTVWAFAQALSPIDPVHTIAYGPQRKYSWWQQLYQELLTRSFLGDGLFAEVAGGFVVGNKPYPIKFGQ